MMSNFCQDCKYFITGKGYRRIPGRPDECDHPELATIVKGDPGYPDYTVRPHCKTIRKVPAACGIEGKFYTQ